MAEKNPPRWMQLGEHDAETDRRLISALMGRRGGIVGTDDLKVWQQSTPGMSVRVASGAVFIPGSEATYQGLYYCENQNAVTVPIAAADATNARIDYIVARVYDQQYGVAGTSNWAIEAITGTAAPSPVAPAVPANCWVLAQVTVGAGVTSIVDANIINLRAGWGSSQRGRAAALGGIITATSNGRPLLAAADEGSVVYETDTDRMSLWNGSEWHMVGGLWRTAWISTNIPMTTAWSTLVDQRNTMVAPCDGTLIVTVHGRTGFSGQTGDHAVGVRADNTTDLPGDSEYSWGYVSGTGWTAVSTATRAAYVAGAQMGYVVWGLGPAAAGNQYIRAMAQITFVPERQMF